MKAMDVSPLDESRLDEISLPRRACAAFGRDPRRQRPRCRARRSRVRDRLAPVVAVRHADDRATGGARGGNVVDRVADHQRLLWIDAEVIASFPERLGVRLGLRHAIAAENELQVWREPEAREHGFRQVLQCVGDDAELESARGQLLQALDRSRENAAERAGLRRVVARVAGQ
jgi:hypothetical protein